MTKPTNNLNSSNISNPNTVKDYVPKSKLKKKRKFDDTKKESQRKDSKDKETNNEEHTTIFKGTSDDFRRKYKTELCKNFEIEGNCKYGNRCTYAHGKENLRLKNIKSIHYKTIKCSVFFESGFCPYGNRCQFTHELQTNIINNPFTLSYSKKLQMLSDFDTAKKIKKLNERNRLPIFEEIVKSQDNKHHNCLLLSYIKSLQRDDI